MPSRPGPDCHRCRYSEGEARRLKNGWALVLWCLALDRLAIDPCEDFALLDGEP